MFKLKKTFITMSLVLFITLAMSAFSSPAIGSEVCFMNQNGIDISHYQKIINWAQIKDSGIDFIYIKATEGVSFIDPKMRKHVAGAESQNLKYGFYHFFHPSSDIKYIKAQARLFYDTIRIYKYACVPVIDIEKTFSLGKDIIETSTLAFISEFQNLNNNKENLMVYSSVVFANKYLTSPDFKNQLYWEAHYTKNAEPLQCFTFDKRVAWQYTSSGHVQGIENLVDLDRATTEIYLNR